MPRTPSIRWAPRRPTLDAARRVGIFGAIVLVIAFALDPGPQTLPPLPWVVAAALLAGGCWVWSGAMARAQHPTVMALGMASLLPAALAWSACWVMPIVLFLNAILRGPEPLAVGAGVTAGAALGWGGAWWSLASLARMVRGLDEGSEREETPEGDVP